MIVDLSQAVVLIFGVVICALSVWGMLAPARIPKLVGRVMAQRWGIHVAVLVRVLLGAALILVADQSRFPVLFQVLGWATLVAAVTIAVLGRQRLRRFTEWFDRASPTLVRVGMLVGIAFGGLLVHGVS